MYLVFLMMVFHCYVSLPEGTIGGRLAYWHSRIVSSGGRQEFVEGLLKLKGPARAIDMAVLGRALVEAARFWIRWSGFS